MYFLMILMAYVEKYIWTHVYMRKSLGIPAYGILNTIFYELLFKSVGMGAQGQKTIMNHIRVKNDAITESYTNVLDFKLG